MRDENTKRENVKQEAILIVQEDLTVRQVGKRLHISKSCVHKDITDYLPTINPQLAQEVQEVLDKHKEERHLNGGLATKKKYASMKKN